MKNDDGHLKVKVYFLLGLFFFLILGLMIGGFNHQINRERYIKWSQEQQLQPVQLISLRGKIVDQRGRLIAESVKSGSIFARPAAIEEPDRTARLLAPYLQMKPRGLYAKLTKNVSFVWLARQIPMEKALAVQRLRLKGIGMEKEGRRYYPNRELASHIIGFVGIDSQGLEGLEWYYDKYIQGQQGSLLLQRDARGRLLWQVVNKDSGNGRGCEIMLSMDLRVQFLVERVLRQVVQETESLAGSVVVMDPQTGEIIAMAGMPAFNPNSYHSSKVSHRRNRSITDTFEPGSTLKAVLLAAALEEGIVNEETLFDCESGSFFYGGHRIHDMATNDELTVREILTRSSNIGATKIADNLTAPTLWKYLSAFGFGRKTGVDLPGEVSGSLRSWKKWAKVDLATHAFGQGLSVTALQMVTAFSVFANGGFLVEPYMVREIRNEDGSIVKKAQSKVVRRIISKRTAERVRLVLEEVVREGSGSKAGLPGFRVAGKTGTAQKFDHKLGKYSNARLVVSFLGIVPADRPELVIAVVLDEPQGKATGGKLAAPVFREIAATSLYYRRVPESGPVLKKAAGPARLGYDEAIEKNIPKGEKPKEISAGLPRQWTMPELRYLSLREAFRVLQGLPVSVHFEGSGMITGQVPEPGEVFQAGQTLELKAAPVGRKVSPAPGPLWKQRRTKEPTVG